MARIKILVNYFAYGSNMDKKDLDMWCEDHHRPRINYVSITPAKLSGYKLVFNYQSTCRKAGAANIMVSSDDRVYGLLIELNEKDLKAIRAKEGHLLAYYEILVNVETFNHVPYINVKTYKVTKEREMSTHQPPTKYYLNLITTNAKMYEFPEEYIEYLESIETID